MKAEFGMPGLNMDLYRAWSAPCERGRPRPISPSPRASSSSANSRKKTDINAAGPVSSVGGTRSGQKPVLVKYPPRNGHAQIKCQIPENDRLLVFILPSPSSQNRLSPLTRSSVFTHLRLARWIAEGALLPRADLNLSLIFPRNRHMMKAVVCWPLVCLFVVAGDLRTTRWRASNPVRGESGERRRPPSRLHYQTAGLVRHAIRRGLIQP
jgi:hypothetical protein